MVLAAVLLDRKRSHDGAQAGAVEEIPSARVAMQEARAECVATPRRLSDWKISSDLRKPALALVNSGGHH